MPTSDPQAVIARWWSEVWGQGRLDLIDELVAEPYVTHSSDGTTVRTPTQLKADMVQYQRILYRPSTTVDDQVVAGDTVWSRLTSRGANVETQQPITISWLTVTRVVDGRIAESWTLHTPGVDWHAGA
jgi:ketosteroid isomerase-like protein